MFDQKKYENSYLKDNCLFNQTIPYIYLGAKTELVKGNFSSSHYMSLIGERWDDSIFTNAETVLKNDTTKIWSTMYSYETDDGNKNGKILYGSSDVTADGITYHMAIKLYKLALNDNRPVLEIACYK